MEAAADNLVPADREGLAWLARLLLELAQERSLEGVGRAQPARRLHLFIRTPEVDVAAARVDDLTIRPGASCVRARGACYEVGVR